MKNNPKSYSVKMYAEMKLEDGRIIATEDDQFMIDSKVFAVGEDGDANPLSKGTYTMENGNKLSIGDNSEVLDLGEEAESVEEENEEELSEENLKEEGEEEKTEMSADVISELMTQVEELNSKIVELSGAPATDSITYNPEGNLSVEKVDFTKLSSQQKAAYYINNLK